MSNTDFLREYHFTNFQSGMNLIERDYNPRRGNVRDMRNVLVDEDGAVSVIYGSRFLTDVAEFDDFGTSDIVDITYTNNNIISVTKQGHVLAVDDQGNGSIIWDQAYADTFPTRPRAWGPTDYVEFAQWGNRLFVINQRDKPIEVSENLSTFYMFDPATGSNLSVPVAEHIVAMNRFLVMSRGSTLYISAEDAPTVFNTTTSNAVELDMSSYVKKGSPQIVALSQYKGNLVVFFESYIVILTLGNFTGSPAIHTPAEFDSFDDFGCISPRTIVATADDLLFLDIRGVVSIARSRFVETLQAGQPSFPINSLLTRFINNLSIAGQALYIFAVHDRIKGRYTVYIPRGEGPDNSTETVGFVFTSKVQNREAHWHTVRGERWSCATRTDSGTIVVAQGTSLFTLGNDDDPVRVRLQDYVESFTDGTTFVDDTGWLPTEAGTASGLPIRFEWELPWYRLNGRNGVFSTRYVVQDTYGTASYTLQAFADNLFADVSYPGEAFSDGTFFTDSFGWIGEDLPTVVGAEMDFVGGDGLGYGGDGYGVLYGGGRITNDPRLYAFRTRGKSLKVRIVGEARAELKFNAIGFHFIPGSIRS